MEKTVREYLTFQEELELSVIYLNLEKLKFLVGLDVFKEEYLYIDDRNLGKVFPLYVINLCYKYIFLREPYHLLAKKNDAMLSYWNEKFGFPKQDDNLLLELCKNKNLVNQSLDYYRDSNHLRSLIDYLNMIDKDFMFLYNKESYPDKLLFQYSYMIHEALIVKDSEMLKRNGVSLNLQKEDKSESVAKELESILLPDTIKNFIDSHDHEGEILALYDEDKFSYRYLRKPVYKAMLYYLLNTKHLKIRVGGNSFRVGESMSRMAKYFRKPGKVIDFDRLFKDELFEWDSSTIAYADKFDFRSIGYNGTTHSIVWYYVNNVTCGTYNDNGEFAPFNSNFKGFWQIIEVIKALGYNNVPKANCAIGCGYDKRISGRQGLMCKEFGIDFINIETLLD